MSYLQQGDIVTLAYPFDDYSNRKIRPAIIVGKSRSKVGAYIVAKVTTEIRQDGQSFLLKNAALTVPTHRPSEVRCNELITISEKEFIRHVASLNKTELKVLCEKIQQNFTVE